MLRFEQARRAVLPCAEERGYLSDEAVFRDVSWAARAGLPRYDVLVAAFATRGLCVDVLRVVLEDHELVIGDVVFEELEHVLRAKPQVPEEWIAVVRVALVTPDPVPRPPAPDPLAIDDQDDAWVVATAVRGGADVVVTGDAALLVFALGLVAPFLRLRRGGRVR